MEHALAICAGIALAAATGFRLFLPLLALSIAAHTNLLTPSPAFSFLSTTPALTLLLTATIIELAAYYIPWLDHALDSITTPLSLVAGTCAVLATFPAGTPEWAKWSMALLAGGAPAGLIQTGTVAARALSTYTTAGIANPVISTIELIAATVLAVLALLVPLLAAALVLAALIWAVRLLLRWTSRRQAERRRSTRQDLSQSAPDNLSRAAG